MVPGKKERTIANLDMIIEFHTRQTTGRGTGRGKYCYRPWLLLVLVLCLGSCALQKKTVHYIPAAERHQHRPPVAKMVPADDRTVQLLQRHFDRWRGTPYKKGGMSPGGVDCSGFVQLTYRNIFARQLPRTVSEQAQSGRLIPLDKVQPGDLVFFKTGFFQRHVGIYLEDGWFLHASYSQGVTRSSLKSAYWREHYWRAIRPSPGQQQG